MVLVPVAPPFGVVMPGSRMAPVEVAMQVPQRPVISAVLGATVEAFLMCAPVGLADVAVNSPMRPMIALMPTVTVVIIVREC